MDSTRFDDLAKVLAAGVSRRKLLKTLSGIAAGGTLASAIREPASAFICRQPGVLCAKDAQCCSGSCGVDHRCVCPDGQLLCHDGTCADCCSTRECGACESCTGGSCISTCTGDQVCVGTSCCTPDDPASLCAGRCGTVPNKCGQPVDCTALCDGCCTAGGACMAGTDSGACGVGGAACQTCTGYNTCGGGGQAGTCGCTPDSPSTTCGSQCDVTLTNNCGQSVTCSCANGTVCSSGTCISCGGANQPCCLDDSCDGGRTCQEGTCSLPASTCDAAESNCDQEHTLCNGNADCRCARSLAGEVFCRGTAVCHGMTCAKDEDCGAGQVCFQGCSGNCCAAVCPS